MDVLVLIDKLDDIIHNARSVPLTDSVMIDREEIYDILDQMRSTIPEEIKQARWIVKERQEMLSEAKQEAERVLAEAQERAEKLASDTEVVRLAEKNAHQIMEDAREREREVRLGRRGLRRRGAGQPRDEPREVHRRGAPRPRAAAGPRRRRRPAAVTRDDPPAPAGSTHEAIRSPLTAVPRCQRGLAHAARRGRPVPVRGPRVPRARRRRRRRAHDRPASATTSRSRSTCRRDVVGPVPALPERRRHRGGGARRRVRAPRRVGRHRRGRGRRGLRASPIRSISSAGCATSSPRRCRPSCSAARTAAASAPSAAPT